MMDKSGIKKIFLDRFPEYDGKDILFFRSPGRVNLIGEHTDYNDGFVFPGAIDKQIIAAAMPRTDKQIRVWSRDLQQESRFSLDELTKGERHWTDYIKGVLQELAATGNLKTGFDAVFSSDLPPESGLSSSAAFEMLNATIASHFNKIAITPADMALLCQRAENRFVGVNCGIMDQFSIALGQESSALFLDTRTLKFDVVRFDLADYDIVIGNTKKPRTLSSSAYNTRRNECGEAVRIISEEVKGIKALRDVTLEQLEAAKSRLDDVVYRRARHVISENERVVSSVRCLKEGQLEQFGRFMNESHTSLRDDYEVSCLELDAMVEAAQSFPGCIGSRMTGAGFGGCTVSLVRKNATTRFIATVTETYVKKTRLQPEFYITKLSGCTGQY